jgi:hypothetical protein
MMMDFIKFLAIAAAWISGAVICCSIFVLLVAHIKQVSLGVVGLMWIALSGYGVYLLLE